MNGSVGRSAPNTSPGLRRNMPNRMKKMLPSIEKTPTASPQSCRIEVHIPERSSRPHVPKWDENIIWDVGVPSSESRSPMTTAASSKGAARYANADQVPSPAPNSGINSTVPKPIDATTKDKQGKSYEFPAIAPNRSPSIPDSGPNVSLGDMATFTTQERSDADLAPAIVVPGASNPPLPITPKPSRIMASFKEEPQSWFPTLTPSNCLAVQHEVASNGVTAPHIDTPRTRRCKLKEDGLVEQSREEYSLYVVESTHRQLRNIERCLTKLLLDKIEERERGAHEAKELGDRKREKKARRARENRDTDEGERHADTKRERHRRNRKNAKRRKEIDGQLREQSGGDTYVTNSVLLGNACVDIDTTSVGEGQPAAAQKMAEGVAPDDAPARSDQAKAKATTLTNVTHHDQAKNTDSYTLGTQVQLPNPTNRQAEVVLSDGAALLNGQVQKKVPEGTGSQVSDQQKAQLSPSLIITRDTSGRVDRKTDNVSKHPHTRSEPNTSSKRDSQRADSYLSSPSPAKKTSSLVSQIPRGLLGAEVGSSVQSRCHKEPPSDIAFSNARKYQVSRPWGYPNFRRELEMPNNRLACKCFYLHPYFKQAWRFEPRLATFPGCKTEFFFQAEQVANCRGHSEEVREFCHQILKNNGQERSVNTCLILL